MTPLLRLAQAVLGGSDGLARDLATRAMDRASREQRARKARARALPRHPAAERATARKADAKDARRQRIAHLRTEAFLRWHGECALCPALATELHHLLSGPERRLKESAETVLPLCEAHHRALHRGEVEALEAARIVCFRAGLALAERAISRRLDKIDEARASNPAAKES